MRGLTMVSTPGTAPRAGRGPMTAAVAVVLLALVASACSAGSGSAAESIGAALPTPSAAAGEATPAAPASSSAPIAPPTAAPSPTPAWSSPPGQAVANDAPCTRTSETLTGLMPVPLHHEDLEAMVLPKPEIDGTEALQDDAFTWGYIDNPEVTSTVPNPPTTCDDIARLGRLDGYANTWSSYSASGDLDRSVLQAVHLFWDGQGAQDWMDAFYDGLAAGAAGPSAVSPGTGYTFSSLPPSKAARGVTIVEQAGANGTRTWAMFRRGPIVGWVVDLHPTGEATTVDIAATAARMADRVETVQAEAAKRPRHGLDVAQLLSAPLPLSEYGERGAGLGWDAFWGGCQDTVERGLIAGDEAAELARRLGRVTGCWAMYGATGSSGPIVRLFSNATVFRDAKGASDSLDALVADYTGRGGREFAVEGLGDEAVGLVTPFTEGDGGTSFTDTRVAMRLGEITAVVAVAQRDDADITNDVTALAHRLEARLIALLGSG